MKKWFFIILATVLQGQTVPWFTGPLIAPAGTVVPYGETMFKSYVYCYI